MTWSIIARDPETGELGIAVASKFLAVGARVPFIAAGVGAVATQALLNPFYGIDGLRLLRDGIAPQDAIRILLDADDGRDHRQVHMMDRHGRVAAHTGAACIGWCGQRAGEGFSVAGNMLAGGDVVDATVSAYAANTGFAFVRRLIVAMQAGDAAGGDVRGRQAAALVIYDDDPWSALDLRVDDHADPLAELARLEQVSRERWVHFRQYLPSSRDRVGITDRAAIEAGIGAALAAEGEP
jgi:uncharacterized Ntn-hydrolase superfamily protein